MNATLAPVTGMYFSAVRNRDDKVFNGQIANVKNMGIKGKLVIVKLDDGKHASVYLDECYAYTCSDFPGISVQGRGE